MIHAEETPVEAPDRQRTHAAHAPVGGQTGGIALKDGGQGGKGVFYAVEFRVQKLVRHPQAEGGAPVVIAGNAVVQPEAFRTFSHKTCGGNRHDVGDMFLEQRKSGGEEAPGKDETGK